MRFIQTPLCPTDGKRGLKKLKNLDPLYQESSREGQLSLAIDVPYTSQEVLRLASSLRALAAEVEGKDKRWFRKHERHICGLVAEAKSVFYDRNEYPPTAVLLTGTALSRMLANKRRTKAEKKLFKDDAERVKENLEKLASQLESLAVPVRERH